MAFVGGLAFVGRRTGRAAVVTRHDGWLLEWLAGLPSGMRLAAFAFFLRGRAAGAVAGRWECDALRGVCFSFLSFLRYLSIGRVVTESVYFAVYLVLLVDM